MKKTLKVFLSNKSYFKDFGKVDLNNDEKIKLDLTIYAQREHFKVTIRENIKN